MIRPVRPEERELLLDIEREAGRAFAAVGMPEIARDDPGTVEDVTGAWVAVDEGDRPVAYLTSRLVDGNAHIEQVSVAPSHARRRIGAALIDHLAAVTGRPLTLTTFRDVPWNAPYYERLGFSVFEPGPELAALVAEEAERIPGDARRVAMRRAGVQPSRGVSRPDYYGNPAGVTSDIDVVQAIYAAFAARDLEGAIRLLSDDCELHLRGTAALIGRTEPYRGHEGMREYFADVQRTWDDLVLFAEDFRAIPGAVVVMGHVEGRVGGETVRRSAVWTWKVQGGKATEVRVADVGPAA